MNVFIAFFKTLPFAFWGFYLFSKLPEKESVYSPSYPMITIALAFLLFTGGKPHWNIDQGILSFHAQTEALESGDTSLISRDFSAASFLIGTHLFPESKRGATIFISVILLASSLLIYAVTSLLSSPLSGLFAQYLFLLCFNYHNQDNLFGPIIIALLLSIGGLYFFFLYLEKNRALSLVICGILWGASTSLFSLTLLFPLSAILTIFIKGKDNKFISKSLLPVCALLSFFVVLSAGVKIYPQVSWLSGWYLPLNLKIAWLRLQRFIWFNRLLVGIFLALLFNLYREENKSFFYCIWGLVFLGIGSMFVTEFDYSQLLLAIPLLVIPVSIWWKRIAFDNLSSVIFISVIIVANLSMTYIDLF